MEIQQFKYIAWCDLGVILLKIHSYSPWDTKMVYTIDEPKLTKPIINIYICLESDIIFNNQKLYRESSMQRGFYVGHHFGLPVKLKQIDEYNIAISCNDPGKIIWCYIIKYVLTIYSINNNMLHIKGGAIEYKGKVFIFLGRGSSGKTQVINTLCQNGAKFMANTHLLVNKNNVMGVKSNIRVRENGSETYLPINIEQNDNVSSGWLPIAGVLWVNYRTDGKCIIKEMPFEYALANVYWFSEAIGNWELKEDIADYCNLNPFNFAIMINRVHNMTNEFCKNNIIHYFNADITSKETLQKTFEFMEKCAISCKLELSRENEMRIIK